MVFLRPSRGFGKPPIKQNIAEHVKIAPLCKPIEDKSSVARAKKGLNTFKDLELPDLRELESEFRLDPTPEIEAGDSVEAAVNLLELHMGFTEPEMLIVPKETIIGTLNILRDKLEHIVEKRLDARERYVLLALDTLEHPYEVWETMYDDEQVRYLFYRRIPAETADAGCGGSVGRKGALEFYAY